MLFSKDLSMLVGLVNKKQKDNMKPSKAFEINVHEARMSSKEIKFDYLDQLTKNNSNLASPRSINYLNISQNQKESLHRKKTPNFMLNKEKRLNRFLTGVKIDNQLNYIIEMEDQILYIGIIGRFWVLF